MQTEPRNNMSKSLFEANFAVIIIIEVRRTNKHQTYTIYCVKNIGFFGEKKDSQNPNKFPNIYLCVFTRK